jgi:Prenyltransferase and squalene oxidase repeat
MCVYVCVFVFLHPCMCMCISVFVLYIRVCCTPVCVCVFRKDFAYWVTEHLRISGFYWGLSALALLDRLDDTDRESILEFAASCRHSSGGYGGNKGHDAHLLYTLSAIQVYLLFKAEDQLDVDAIVACTCSTASFHGSSSLLSLFSLELSLSLSSLLFSLFSLLSSLSSWWYLPSGISSSSYLQLVRHPTDIRYSDPLLARVAVHS